MTEGLAKNSKKRTSAFEISIIPWELLSSTISELLGSEKDNKEHENKDVCEKTTKNITVILARNFNFSNNENGYQLELQT